MIFRHENERDVIIGEGEEGMTFHKGGNSKVLMRFDSLTTQPLETIPCHQPINNTWKWQCHRNNLTMQIASLSMRLLTTMVLNMGKNHSVAKMSHNFVLLYISGTMIFVLTV